MESNSSVKKKRKNSDRGIWHIYQGPSVNKLCVLRNSENIVKSEDMTWSKDFTDLSPKVDTTFEGRYSVFLPDHNIRIPKAPAFRSFAQADIDAFLDRNRLPKTRNGVHSGGRPPKYLQKLSVEDIKLSNEKLTKATVIGDLRNKLTGRQKMVLPDIKTSPRLNSSKTEDSNEIQTPKAGTMSKLQKLVIKPMFCDGIDKAVQ